MKDNTVKGKGLLESQTSKQKSEREGWVEGSGDGSGGGSSSLPTVRSHARSTDGKGERGHGVGTKLRNTLMHRTHWHTQTIIKNM